MGSVTKEMESHKTAIRRGCTEIHRNQAIVERFNSTLPKRLFGNQYAMEMLLASGQRSTAWVKGLPDVIEADGKRQRLLLIFYSFLVILK